MTNYRDQQFKIVITNHLLDFDLKAILYIDGEGVTSFYFRAGDKQLGEFRGVQNSATTLLPFKFQELEIVGTFYEHFSDIMFVPYCIICY